LLVIYLPLLFATYAFQAGDYYFVLRLSFLPAWLCAAGLAWIAARLHETGARKMACILLLAFIALTAATAMRRMGGFPESFHEYDIQAKFIENAGPEAALFASSALNGYDNDLQLVTLAAGHAPAGLIQYGEDIYPGIKSYWEYDVRCRCMAQLSQAQVVEKASRLDRLRTLAEKSAPIPLLVTWQARQGLATIVVEPEGESWCLLAVPGIHPITVCPKSSISLVSRIPPDKFALLHAQFSRVGQNRLFVISPFMNLPADGTLQWSRGVFLPDSVQRAKAAGTCHIDTPGNMELMQPRGAPLELRGWILGPSNLTPDEIPLAILAGSSGKNYVANLYREPRPDVRIPEGMAIGGHILDADLRRVESGAYRLLLSIDNAICDTGIPMTVR
jgi:hypothetical protein